MKTNNIKAWATFDPDKNAIICLCETREQARHQLRYAKSNGWNNFKLVKLAFDKVVR